MKNLVREFDLNSNVPLHRQIEKALRENIATGEYDHGKLFPNEVALSNLFGVSRNTVRQAFNVLVNEGLLKRKQGKGTTVVRHTSNVTHLEEWHSFSKDMAAQGVNIKNYQIAFTSEICDRQLATELDVLPETEVKKLTRIKGNESAPFVLFESWFHPRIPLNGHLDFTQPLNEILENEFSVIAMHSSEELSAITADERIADLLQVEKGAPVFYRKRRVYDAGMRIVEFNKCYYRHDKMTYRINIKRTL